MVATIVFYHKIWDLQILCSNGYSNAPEVRILFLQQSL